MALPWSEYSSRWLETRLQFLGVTHLAFCGAMAGSFNARSRPQAAQNGSRIKSRYLYVSRRTLNLGHAGIPGADGRLSSAALDRLTETSGNVDHFLKRGGLSGCEALERELRKAFGSEVIRWEDQQQLRALLQENAHEVLAALEPMRQLNDWISSADSQTRAMWALSTWAGEEHRKAV